MATTTNFGWETPDDTDLVKDGAAAIRTLGSAIDTSLVDLKGGTTGQILSKTSNTDMDFTWAAAPTTATNWTLLNTGGTALTGAQTITISGISGKNKLLVLVENGSSANASSAIGVRLNGVTTNDYYNYGSSITASAAYSANSIVRQDLALSYMRIATMSNDAGSQVAGGVLIDGCNTAGLKSAVVNGGASANGGTGQGLYTAVSYINIAAAITSVSVFSSSGNFDNGTVYVFGSDN